MIKEITLENFQIHESLDLKFSPLFNTIVGPSRKGKSSIVRALNWVFFCKWDSSFVKTQSKFCKVKILFEDNNLLVWKKGETVNELFFNKDKFVSFGSSLPEEILKVYPWMNLVFSDLVISLQDDPPFLLGDNPSDRLNKIDELSKLSLLKRFFDNVVDEANSINYKKNQLKSRIDELEDKIKSYGDIETKIEKLDELIDKFTKIEEKKNRIDSVIKTMEFLEKKKKELNKLVKQISFYQQYNEKLEYFLNVNELLKKLEKQASLSNLLNSVINEIAELENKLSEILSSETLKCPVCDQPISNVDRVIENMEKLVK